MSRNLIFKGMATLLVASALFSCTQTNLEIGQGLEPIGEENMSMTRAIAGTNTDLLRDSIYQAFFVPYQDAQIYAAIHCRGNNAKEFDTIVPLTDGIDTLMYLIQYKEGWDVIAADKRGPLVVAMSEEGRFISNDTLSVFFAYLEGQKLYLKSMRDVADYNPESDVYIFWSMLHPQNNSNTRLIGDEGHWELYDTEIETITRESGHMIQTKWGQNQPWDTFVPYNSKKTNEKCAVGCVAVAGAQMLYYLHHKLGYPQTMYTSGGCVGYNDGYSASFSNPTADAWNNMALTKNDGLTARKEQAALLMAYVGTAVNMDYGESSSAETKDLKDLFDDWGISSTFGDYNSTVAWNSLQNNMPVIVKARTLTDKFPYNAGHAWIMDGWKTITTYYTYYYGWVPTPQPNSNVGPVPIQPAPNPDDSFIYTETQTQISATQTKMVLMNWGWDGAWDNIYFALDGAWSPYSDVSFQYLKKMLHGFSVK